jgi:hypothetical protein
MGHIITRAVIDIKPTHKGFNVQISNSEAVRIQNLILTVVALMRDIPAPGETVSLTATPSAWVV